MIPSLNKIRRFEYWLLIGFFGLGLIGILNHAMWRDELNGWLIARDSLNLQDFWQNIRYEGHPILWYLCLLALNQLTTNPLAMQLLHLGIATLAIAIFIFKSPFTRHQRLLFCLGYLPLYEYLIISRNYALGILCLFIICSIFPQRQQNYWPIALLLALLANTNAYGLLLSFCLAIALIGEYLFQHKLAITIESSRLHLFGAMVIYGLGLALALAMLLPPADSTLQGGAEQWFLQWDFHRFNQAITRIWNSYILILVPGDSRHLDVGLFAALSVLIFGFWLLFFSDTPVVFSFYLLGSLIILVFTYLKFLGSARHYGHLYIVLILSLWLRHYYAPVTLIDLDRFNLPWQRLRQWVKAQSNLVLMIILISQLLAGMVAYIRDLTLPYSASREVTHYLIENQLNDYDLVGSDDFTISPISGYLNQKIYYPESQALGSFVLFNSRRRSVSDADILEQISRFSRFPLLLILNHPLEAELSSLSIQPLTEFKRSFIGNEQYYLYQINRKI